MELVKASDLKKIFIRWSNGTLYNRLDSLKIRGNPIYCVVNEGTGVITYNRVAIDVLKEKYVKEYPQEIDNINKAIDDYLSSMSSFRHTKVNENKETKENLKNDNIESVDNSVVINDVILRYINENYISKNIHNELINDFKKQIEVLQHQLEKETETNQKLVDTIKLREQKDAVIEQQKLIQLQDNVKLIAEPEQQEVVSEKKGLISWIKDFKKYF